MQELKVIGEYKDRIILSWKKIDIANEYIIEGLTKNFAYNFIARTKDCTYICDKNPEFVGYRVAYVNNIDNQDFVIDTTNIADSQVYELKPINIVTIKSSHNMVSLSFRSEEHFDLYRLYNEQNELVAQTEDCIVLGFYAGKKYYVEGYNKINDSYKLIGRSELTYCEPIQNIQNNKLILSVVIPVYNCENFLSRTIQSILSSTFTDFEIIIVDDCSNQPTRELCDWYSENFDCISVIHKENKGGGNASAARNTGLNNVKGEWIAYIDGDDIIHPYMFEKLYKNAIELGTDAAIAQCIMREDYDKHKLVLAANINENIIVMNSYKEVIEGKANQRNIFFVAVWNKIVKTEIARKIKFNEKLSVYEDTAYTTSLYSYCNKFVLVKDAYYIWDKRRRKTEGTLSSTYKSSYKSTYHIWVDYILAFLEPLFIGNQDNEIAMVYKYDILKEILKAYSSTDSAEVKNIISGLLKYYVREYNLPVDKLQQQKEDKLLGYWNEITNNGVEEYDGTGEIPFINKTI